MRISDWSSDVCSSDLDGVRADPEQRLSVEPHRAGVRRDAADEAVQQGRFAGAVGADDGVHRPLPDLEVDLIKRAEPGELLAHAVDVEVAHVALPQADRLERDLETHRDIRPAPSIRPPGRKITISMNKERKSGVEGKS